MTDPLLHVVAIDFIPSPASTRCGYAAIRLPELGLTVRGLSIHFHPEHGGYTYLPLTPIRDEGGRQQRSDGRAVLQTAMIIEGDELRWTAFRKAVFEAVVSAFPEAMAAQITALATRPAPFSDVTFERIN